MTDFRDKASFDGCRCVHETGEALLVEIEGDQYWLPLSQLDDTSEIQHFGDEGELVTSQWWADQEGI